jgi:hypothetical protein
MVKIHDLGHIPGAERMENTRGSLGKVTNCLTRSGAIPEYLTVTSCMLVQGGSSWPQHSAMVTALGSLCPKSCLQ